MLTHTSLKSHAKTYAKRFCNSLKCWANYGLLSTTITTLVPQYGCDSSKTEKSQTQAYQEISKTNSSGEVSFFINNKTYELRLLDRFTQKPVRDMYVLITVTGDSAIYFVLDPKNEYHSDIFSTNDSLDISKAEQGIIRQALSPEASRIERHIFGKNEACTRIGAYFLKDQLPEEVLKETPTETEDNLKSYGFEKVSPEKGIKLSELNDYLATTIQFLFGIRPGEALEGLVETYLLKLGVQSAKRIVSATSAVLLAADLCEIGQQFNYGSYYKSLCYSDEDTFSIYKYGGWNGIQFQLGPLPVLSTVTNPIMIILPDKKPNSWEPPTARIIGRIEDGIDPQLHQRRPQINFSNLNNGVLRYFIDASAGEFDAEISACEETQQYLVGVEDVNEFGARLVPLTSVRISVTQTPNPKADRYNLTFVDAFESCEHVPYYEDKDRDGVGNEYRVKVACEKPEGYVETPGDCDDTDPLILQVCESIMSVEDASVVDAGILDFGKPEELNCVFEATYDCQEFAVFEDTDSILPIIMSERWSGSPELYVSFRSTPDGPIYTYSPTWESGSMHLNQIGIFNGIPQESKYSVLEVTDVEGQELPILRYLHQGKLHYTSPEREYGVEYWLEPAGRASSPVNASDVVVHDYRISLGNGFDALVQRSFNPEDMGNIFLSQEIILEPDIIKIGISNWMMTASAYPTKFMDTYDSTSRLSYLTSDSCVYMHSGNQGESCWNGPITPVFDETSAVFAEGQVKNYRTQMPVSLHRSFIGENGLNLENSSPLANNVTAFVPGAYVINDQEVYAVSDNGGSNYPYELMYCTPGVKTLRRGINGTVIIGLGPVNEERVTRLVACRRTE